jgi:hypothetical protein
MGRPFLALLALAAACASACQGPRLLPADEAGRSFAPAVAARPTPVRPAPAQPLRRGPPRRAPRRRVWAGPPCAPPRRGAVHLRPADLAGVRAWIDASNRQWILGRDVDVYASKEFFSQVLTVNATYATVRRDERRVGDDLLVTLTYVGLPSLASAMTNPRVLIGTGLTISAAKTLRLRLAKTSDPRRPVQLRIVAHGKAAWGRAQTVEQRADQLELGGVLAHDGRRWVWTPFRH